MDWWPSAKTDLLEAARVVIAEFCALNEIETPAITSVEKSEWHFDVCAYYRPKCGIMVCLDKCQTPCGVVESRNWTWPASVTDREPFGVVAHELGHHCDVIASDKKGSYYGDYSISVRAKVREPKLTSYCPNDAEWFAEMFRLFVTNPQLLKALRPRTFAVLIDRWKPVVQCGWIDQLGGNVPDRIVRTLRNKGAK